MTGEIRYNVEGMKEQAQKLTALAENVEGVAVSMNAVFENLAGEYSGEGYEKLVAEYEQFKGHQNNFSETIKAFAQMIEQIGMKAEVADEDAAKQAASIIEGGSSTSC